MYRLTRIVWALLVLATPSSALAADADADGLQDAVDNCIEVVNASQCDADGDGHGNHCDGDFDQDLFVYSSDFDLWLADFQTGEDSGVGTDMNCDGKVNAPDLSFFGDQYSLVGVPGPSGLFCAGLVPCVDGDHDGVMDHADICTDVANASQWDADEDGYGNHCDGDFDQDLFAFASDYDAWLADFQTGEDSGVGTDMNCDGKVNAPDLSFFGDQYSLVGVPGPSGLSCAGAVPCGERAGYQTNSGGGAVPPFSADDHVTGGVTLDTASAIDLSNPASADPAPEAVYQSARSGASTYAFPNLQVGRSYRVRLHFAEIVKTDRGQRTFDVIINGEQMLTNFDVWGHGVDFFHPNGSNRAVIKDFFARADEGGRIVVELDPGSIDAPIVSGLEVSPDLFLQVNAGGPASAPFEADGHVQGGAILVGDAPIDTSGVPHPAPDAVYATARQGASTYTFAGLVEQVRGMPNHVWAAQYGVRLHFAELAVANSGERRFDVAINGAMVLDDFDVVAAAGAPNRAIVREFTAPADSSGTIAVAFVDGSAGVPLVNGIEVYRIGAESWLAADELFKRDVEWRGGDGAASVDLGNGRILWLFADSFVDLIPPYGRPAPLIRNSIAIQQGANPETASFDARWRLSGRRPSDFFAKPVPSHFIWPSAGRVVNGRLLVFGAELTGPGLDLTLIANRVFAIDNHPLDPAQWTVASHVLPDPDFTAGPLGVSTVIHDEGYLYVWGAGAATGIFCPTSLFYVWRYSDAAIQAADFSNPEYWTGSSYVPLDQMTGDPAAVGSLGVQIDMHRDAATGRYVSVQGGPCFGPLEGRRAPAPEGPWPAPIGIHSTADNGRPEAFATYLWKAHPWLEGALPTQVVVTYSTHGEDSGYNETKYYPRFLRSFVP